MLHLIYCWILFWTFKWNWSVVSFFNVIFSQDLLSVFGLNKRPDFHALCSKIVLELCVLELIIRWSFKELCEISRPGFLFNKLSNNFPNFLIRLLSNVSIYWIFPPPRIRPWFSLLIYYSCLYQFFYFFEYVIFFLQLINFKHKRSSKDQKLRFHE